MHRLLVVLCRDTGARSAPGYCPNAFSLQSDCDRNRYHRERDSDNRCANDSTTFPPRTQVIKNGLPRQLKEGLKIALAYFKGLFDGHSVDLGWQ